jgi:hypothetical protein
MAKLMANLGKQVLRDAAACMGRQGDKRTFQTTTEAAHV